MGQNLWEMDMYDFVAYATGYGEIYDIIHGNPFNWNAFGEMIACNFAI